MINWPIVLSAFCAGLALTFYLSAREKIRNLVSPSARVIGRLLGGLSLTAALAAAGLLVSAASHSTDAALTLSTPSPSSQETASHLPSSVAQSGRPSSEVLIPSTQQPHDGTLLPSSFFLPPSSSPTPSSRDIPPRLQIPSLNIDAPVQTIPIHDGQWDLTTLGTEVGWLTTTGARPGDALAMVFVGHITVSEKEHGSFAYLQKIQKDAEIIYQAAGTSYVYHVESISRAGQFDVNRLYLADGNSLLLITCTDWDPAQRVYTNRLMVQARLEN